MLESATWQRWKLTREIVAAYSLPPFDRLADGVQAWLSEVDELLQIRDRYAHSVTYYQVWGDGRAGSFSEHPRTGAITEVVDQPELDVEILRFSDAVHAGVDLEFQTMTLRGGPQAHDEYLRAREEYERSVEEMFRESSDS